MNRKTDFTQSLDAEVLIIGAGIAGISAAYHLKKYRPNSTFIILEGRDDIGGTWSLFRYPGIRSDSDMQSFAFGFKPWTQKKTFGSAQMICDYLHETVIENGIDQYIQFGSYVTSAEFSSNEGIWTVKVKQKDQKSLVTYVLASYSWVQVIMTITMDIPLTLRAQKSSKVKLSTHNIGRKI